MRRPATPHPELVDLVLGRLDARRRETVDRLAASRPDVAEEARRIRDHLARYDVIRPPAPPPFDRLAPHLEAPRRVRGARGRVRPAGALAAALLAAVALALLLPPSAPPGAETTTAVRAGRGLRVAGRALAPGVAVPAGSLVTARAPAALTWGARGRVVLDAGAHLEVLGGDLLHLEAGRIFVDLEPGTPFRVHTPEGDVRVLGTAFEVDLTAGRLAVAVERGRVEAGGAVLGAGQRLEPDGVTRVQGLVGGWFRRPRLTIEVTRPATTTSGAWLDLVLAPPGELPVALPDPDGGVTALWLTVEGPGGAVRDLAVPGADHPFGRGADPAHPHHLRLEPGETWRHPVRLTVEEPGTYRCRAMYRPEGEPPLLSPVLLLEVLE